MVETKNNNISKYIRLGIYSVLFALIIIAFIYLSKKYEEDPNAEETTILTYYPEIEVNTDRYEVVSASDAISLIKRGKNILIFASQTSKWTESYIENLEQVFQEENIEKIYLFDLTYDKSKKTSSYYEIRELLENYLITTDDNEDDLLAPSFYIIEEGQVLYYNIDTVAMKNTIEPDDYWNSANIAEFQYAIKDAISKYYLNN